MHKNISIWWQEKISHLYNITIWPKQKGDLINCWPRATFFPNQGFYKMAYGLLFLTNISYSLLKWLSVKITTYMKQQH
jgi:hypothetical protein